MSEESLLDRIECIEDDMRLLRYENTELRELVQELYEDQCEECDQWRYRDRMHELGIEVEL